MLSAMNTIYGSKEPGTINEQLLNEAIHAQGPKGDAAKLAREEGLRKEKVTALQLDYRNILKITNLDFMTSLVKLQLDNNIIEKIEGISHLVNLKWLDLSFNKISRIEGLEALNNLEDLTLQNNRISKLENVDSLSKLHIFSIGSNELKDLDDILNIRTLRALRTFNAAGNPFCKETNYKSYLLAFLPQLQYLDYKLVKEEDRLEANEKYSLRIEEFAAEDLAKAEKEEKDKLAMIEYNNHIEAFVEGLNGSKLFETMFEEDKEGRLFLELPNLEDMLNEFREKFVQSCQELFQFGLVEKDRRSAEVQAFKDCLNAAKTQCRSKSNKLIVEFQAYKLKTVKMLLRETEVGTAEELLQDFRAEVGKLWNSLMGLELTLVDQLEDVMKEFSLNLNEMVTSFIENLEANLSVCRESEAQFHERLTEHCILMMEKIMKGELDEELSEDVKMVSSARPTVPQRLQPGQAFVDKDAMLGTLSGSHDNKLLVIDGKADEITQRVKKWSSTLIDFLHEQEEVKRNRNRVYEISRYCDQQKTELDNLDIPAFG